MPVSPPKDIERFDLSEVVVTRSQRHVAFQCHGCNPEVIFGNWRAFGIERLGYLRIDLGSCYIRIQHRCDLQKFVHLRAIRLGTRRLQDTSVELP
jgi:hypothetical protein